MATPRIREWTPVTPRGGGLVHATSLETPRKTVCDMKCDGWVVAPLPLTCQRCKEVLHLPVKRKAER